MSKYIASVNLEHIFIILKGLRILYSINLNKYKNSTVW